MDPVRFHLKDRNGELHEYEVGYHTPSEGTRLALTILSCLAEPGARLIQEVLPRIDKIQDLGLSGDMDVSEAIPAVVKALDGLDIAAVGVDVAQVLRNLEPALVKACFSKTKRDGKYLAQDQNYDEAYAGNWGELYKALMRIVRVNDFVPFLSTLSDT